MCYTLQISPNPYHPNTIFFLFLRQKSELKEKHFQGVGEEKVNTATEFER